AGDPAEAGPAVPDHHGADPLQQGVDGRWVTPHRQMYQVPEAGWLVVGPARAGFPGVAVKGAPLRAPVVGSPVPGGGVPGGPVVRGPVVGGPVVGGPVVGGPAIGRAKVGGSGFRSPALRSCVLGGCVVGGHVGVRPVRSLAGDSVLVGSVLAG